MRTPARRRSAVTPSPGQLALFDHGDASGRADASPDAGPARPVAQHPPVRADDKGGPAIVAAAGVDDDAPADAPALALAEALHARLLRWSLHLDADEVAASAAAEAGRRLSLAQGEGHLCILVDDPLLRVALNDSKLVARPQQGVLLPQLPFVLDDANRLYFHRAFVDEQRLARRLVQAQTGATMPALDLPLLKPRLAALFPSVADQDGVDRQKLAAALALVSPVLLISGGPGTGKTTTLARLLDLVLTQAPTTRVVLAAPTGKAAARMTAALGAAAAKAQPAGLPRLVARTVHGLLGVHPRTGRARHHARRPLDVDLLVVDEASMLDLALARQLLAALPPAARLVMLGDKDQLAAVQAGAVFAELAGGGIARGALEQAAALCGLDTSILQRELDTGHGARGTEALAASHSVIHFTRSHRFGAQSVIARLARLVRDGDADAAVALLHAAHAQGEVSWLQPDADAARRHQHLRQAMAPYLEALHALQRSQASTPENAGDGNDSAAGPLADCLRALDHWRLLCAVHDGPSGTRSWNAAASALVRRELGEPLRDAAAANEPDGGAWFGGRAVLVTRNDDTLGLVNGDVGIVLPPHHGEWPRRVAFLRADGSVLRCPATRLPAVETAFATSVHKAQGSEFLHVTLSLPSPWQRPCTRELLYTALTRARTGLAVLADEDSLRRTIATRTQRLGGLATRLAEALAEASVTG